MKKFTARQVLTITTGRLLTERKASDDNGISGAHDMAAWPLNAKSYMSHHISSESDRLRRIVFSQHPDLEKINKRLGKLDEMLEEHPGEEDVVVAKWINGLLDAGAVKPFYYLRQLPEDQANHLTPTYGIVEILNGDRK